MDTSEQSQQQHLLHNGSDRVHDPMSPDDTALTGGSSPLLADDGSAGIGSSPSTAAAAVDAGSSSSIAAGRAGSLGSSGGGGATRGSGGRVAKSCSVHIREPPVSDTSGYTVVRNEEKHGPLQRAIPTMPFALAVVACIFNIVLPGTGTLISAFSVFCCGTSTRMNSRLHAFLLNVVSGLLQFATFLLIVGWIWSITWGMTFVQLALSAKENRERSPVPYYVRRHSSVE